MESSSSQQPIRGWAARAFSTQLTGEPVIRTPSINIIFPLLSSVSLLPNLPPPILHSLLPPHCLSLPSHHLPIPPPRCLSLPPPHPFLSLHDGPSRHNGLARLVLPDKPPWTTVHGMIMMLLSSSMTHVRRRRPCLMR